MQDIVADLEDRAAIVKTLAAEFREELTKALNIGTQVATVRNSISLAPYAELCRPSAFARRIETLSLWGQNKSGEFYPAAIVHLE